MAFKLRSPAFGPGGEIPVRYTVARRRRLTLLGWGNPPEGTKSFALIPRYQGT
jgi:phosphatidylethanolamine-binding protein (PEBP) family uncharacterized protein